MSNARKSVLLMLPTCWLLLFCSFGSGMASDHFVEAGSVDNTINLDVSNTSSLLWLFDVNIDVLSQPGFVLNLTPTSTPTIPSIIYPGATGTAAFSFDVDAGAWDGATGTIEFQISTSTGDTTFKEIDLIVGVIAPLVSLPYFEDFELDNGYYIGTGSWEWGVPTSGPGSAYSGANAWATSLYGDYLDESQDFLHTLFIDLTGTVAPRLTFYHYYDMEWGLDGGIVQVSTDDGLTFQTIEPVWGYPDFVGGTPAFTALSTPDSTYIMETFYLASFAGDTILIRFQFASDLSVTRPGWYVDDVAVEESPAADAATIDIVVEPGILTSMGPLDVKAQIVNFGSATQTFNVRLEVDTLGGSGGDVFSNVKQVTSLAPTDTTLVTFDTWIPVEVGCYDLRVISQLAGDADPTNDTVFAQTYIIGIVAVPYFQDFEVSEGGFFATGSWEWGVPTSGPGSAYSGEKLWATDLDTNYIDDAQDFLYLPALDLTGGLWGEIPALSFYHYYDMEEGYDGGVVQISTDRGLTFTTLTPRGGYPDAINYGEDPAYTGLSTPDSSYVEAKFDLSPYKGDTVILRLQFVSDFSMTSPGWYVDDVAIILQKDLGTCDTLHVETFDCDHFYDADTGSFDSVRVAIYVTHDSNTFWWQDGNKWVQDSIWGFVIPLNFWHQPEGYADSVILPTWDNWNNTVTSQYDPRFNRSIYRHIVDMHTGEIDSNRMARMVNQLYLPEWSTTLDVGGDGDSGHVFISIIASSASCRRWWDGERVLLATLTFLVYMSDTCDTTQICLDSTFWPPGGWLFFVRHDAVDYVPCHFLPVCDTIYIMPYICGDCNGDEIIDAADVVYLINHLFVIGAPPPEPLCIGDVNCDGLLDAADVVALINHLFVPGAPPPCPNCCDLKAKMEKLPGQKIERDFQQIRPVPQKGPKATGGLKRME